MNSESMFLPHGAMDDLSIKSIQWKNAHENGQSARYSIPEKEFKRIWGIGRERWPYSRRHVDKYVVKDKGRYRFTRYGQEILKENGYGV